MQSASASSFRTLLKSAALAVAGLVLATGHDFRAAAAENGDPAKKEPESFTRVTHPDPETIALQIALRRYQSDIPTAPAIWLVAVSHIGETNYYGAIQAFLESQGLVLFEGVGEGADFKRRSRMLRERAVARQAGEPVEEETGDASLQSTLAESLDLAFQLDAIHYDHDHFINSDLSLEQLQLLLVKQIRKQTGEGEKTETNPAFLALMQAMDGTSWLGAIMHMGVKMLGSSPKLKAMTRLMLIEILGQVKGDLTKIQGIPPDMQKLIEVLILERNKVVIGDLKSRLNARDPVDSIAVFYGAGHMDDLEKRLKSELKYEPVETRWLPAVTVKPSKAGLTAVEIKMIQGMVQWQLKVLGQEQTDLSSEPSTKPRPPKALTPSETP